MSLITVAINLIFVGVLLRLVTKHIPMEKHIENILVIAVIAAVVLWLASAFGLTSLVDAVKIVPIK